MVHLITLEGPKHRQNVHQQNKLKHQFGKIKSIPKLYPYALKVFLVQEIIDNVFHHFDIRSNSWYFEESKIKQEMKQYH